MAVFPQSSPPLVDAAQNVPALRTLGTGHQQAAPGDHTHEGLLTYIGDITKFLRSDGQWAVPPTGTTDSSLVKVTSDDPSPGTLGDKIVSPDGSITITTAQINSDYKLIIKGPKISVKLPLPNGVASAGTPSDGEVASWSHTHPATSQIANMMRIRTTEVMDSKWRGSVGYVLVHGESFGFGSTYEQIDGVGRWQALNPGPLVGQKVSGTAQYSDGDIFAIVRPTTGSESDSMYYGLYVVEDCGIHTRMVPNDDGDGEHEETYVTQARFRRFSEADSPSKVQGMVFQVAGIDAEYQGKYFRNTNAGTIVLDETKLTFEELDAYDPSNQSLLLTDQQAALVAVSPATVIASITPTPDGVARPLSYIGVTEWFTLPLGTTSLASGKTKFHLNVTLTDSDPQATPPADGQGGGDPYYDKVVSLLHFNGDLVDEIGKTWTPNNCTIVSTEGIPKFGSGCIWAKYLHATTPASSDWAFGTGDFTVEFWSYRLTLVGVFATIVGTWYYSTPGSGWAVSDTGSAGNAGLAFRCNDNQYNSSAEVTDNTWHAIAVCRTSGVLRMFLDGHKVGEWASTDDISSATNQLCLGGNNGTTDAWNGYIDELRISKGVGRYTADYIVQTAPFNLTPGVTGYRTTFNVQCSLVHADGSVVTTHTVGSQPLVGNTDGTPFDVDFEADLGLPTAILATDKLKMVFLAATNSPTLSSAGVVCTAKTWADLPFPINDGAYDSAGAAASVQAHLDTHAALTGAAHGGIVAPTRKVNGKSLDADVSLTTADVPDTAAKRYVAQDLPDDATKFYNGAGQFTTPPGSTPTDANIVFSDVATNDASTIKHGFLSKLSGNATDYLGGDNQFHALSEVTGNLTTFELTPPELLLREVVYIPSDVSTDLQPSSLVETNEQFSDATTTRFTEYVDIATSPSSASFLSIANGQVTHAQTYANGHFGDIVLTGSGSLKIPQFAVSVTVNSMTPTGSPIWDSGGPIAAKDGANYIVGYYDRAGGLLAFAIQVGGVVHSNLASQSITLTAPFSLMMTLVSNSLVLWYKPNNGTWTKGPVYDASTYIDMRAQDLTVWRGGWGKFVDGSATKGTSWNFSNLKIGRFGHLGMRDQTLVTTEDGTPVISNSNVAFTATCTDCNGAAYMGAFTYNLTTKALTQTSVVFVDRSGKRYNDNASHIVVASDGGYHFLITTWGNAGGPASGIQILYKKETVLNLLSGAHAVSGMSQPALAGIPANGGGYDPYLVKSGNTWYLAWTAGPNVSQGFYPVLNSSTDLNTWTLVGALTTVKPYEGTKIIKVAGELYMATSSLNLSVFYDMNMGYRGSQTFKPTGSGNPPHPMFFVYGPYVYCITFDMNTNGWNANTFGSFIVLRGPRYGVAPLT